MKLVLVAALAVGCAGPTKEGPDPDAPKVVPHHTGERPRTEMKVRPMRAPEVELFYKGDQPFARRGGEEWSLGDVKKDEMSFSPDKKRFAYVREKQSAAQGKAPAWRVLVRNLAGDPINEFAVYRPGKIDELIWLDNHRIGYLAPSEPAPKKSAPVYVVHDVNTGEILAARTGAEFIWGPDRRHVAFVSGAGIKQQVVVDGQGVWPRYGVTRINGLPVWSPDGHGLAFTEDAAKGPRLVVLVEFDDAQGDLTWNIPRDALGAGLKVFWAGDSKVVIGETALQPRFAADWQRLK
jgi:hypothetical protein